MPRILQDFMKRNNTWNIRRLVDESFVQATQRTSVLYWRLSDFNTIPLLQKSENQVQYNLDNLFRHGSLQIALFWGKSLAVLIGRQSQIQYHRSSRYKMDIHFWELFWAVAAAEKKTSFSDLSALIFSQHQIDKH